MRRLSTREKSRGSALDTAKGSQLLEFALALPLLALLVIGIWDFGSGFELKQNIANAARQAARIMVSTPLRNITSGPACTTQVPCAVISAATAVQNSLTNAGLDGSWIAPSSPTSTPSGLCTPGNSTWTWSSTSGTGANSMTYQLQINAAAGIQSDGTVVADFSPGAGEVQATQVTLTWPINWNAAAPFPSGTFGKQISSTITMADIGGGCVL